MTRFCTRNITTLFGVQFLIFPVSTVEKCFGQILTTFRVQALPEKKEKLKTGPTSLGLAPETYPHFLGCNSYRFPSVQLKYVSVEFWPLFRDRGSRKSRELDLDDSVLHPKQTHTFLDAILIVSRQYGWKMFQSNFDDFSGLGTTGEKGKVENGAYITWFSDRNIPTLFGVQFLSFPISTAKKWFSRILTTFPFPGTTGAGKVENRARMTRFCTRKYPYFLGYNFYHFPSGWLKNVSIEFWGLFGSLHH